MESVQVSGVVQFLDGSELQRLTVPVASQLWVLKGSLYEEKLDQRLVFPILRNVEFGYRKYVFTIKSSSLWFYSPVMHR